MLLGVTDEVSLMAWANTFYTLGFTTATLRLPRCLGQTRAISARGGSVAPGLEVLGKRSHPTGTSASGHSDSQQSKLQINLLLTRGTCQGGHGVMAVS